uniref:Nidogen 2 n=1 Tax=Junco hyemalis TaxID=40217 RepID=A0A8C5ILG2_JUNHY
LPLGAPVAAAGMRAAAALLAAVLALGAALPRPGLLPHGPARGDARLRPGDDESSPGLLLRRALRLYGRAARRLYVGTNGVISSQDFPRETQYVDDDFPTDFPVIAPFLADLDTSGDRGNIYYRQDDSRDVLEQALGYIQAGFPRSAAAFVPTNAFIATWEEVGAYQELSQDTEPSTKLNTFQAVIAYNDEDTYSIFLYPEGGLQFLGTRPKESYNVQLELPARVGFSWGDSDDPKRDGLFHSLASSERALRGLERWVNLGGPAVGRGSSITFPQPWSLSEPGKTWGVTLGCWAAPGAQIGLAALPATGPAVGPPWHVPGGAEPCPSQLSPKNTARNLISCPLSDPSEIRQQVPNPPPPSASRVTPLGTATSSWLLPSFWGQEGKTPTPCEGWLCHRVPRLLPLSPVFTYSAASRETCAQHHGQCSPHAFCTDYAAGFCCHCRASFYGNGRQCLPEGAVHRLNGKVSGSLRVGRASVRFQDVDLHAYIVGSDGRAYTAISGVPQPAARALLPLLPLGGLFAWLFALEEPGSENGFSITGAEFTQNLEVVFYPGGETVQVTQTAEGLGPDNYLSLRTHIQGEVPFLPENVTVHITPYEELYSYSSSAVTSSGHREYVVAAGTANQTLSYRLRQNITVAGCPHARPPARQRLSVARAFALFDSHEHVLRYALAARIGPAPGELQHPPPGCSEGLSQCGPFSVCLNEPGSYRCECRGGYQPAGDGQACVPLAPPSDPCEAGRHHCAPGDRARCLSRGDGRATCECLPGYTGDGIHCSDVDECAQSPCHPAAICYNTPGSFSCRCRPSYAGDGFQCTYAGLGLTPCEHARMYPREVPPGPSPVGDGHVPQCDEQGRYRPLQCHSSSGHCWCVDAAGQEIAGTRTAPGTTPPRCGSPEPTERPPSMCERWRQSLLEHYGGSPRGDQYVPQCEPSGDFAPLQCHGDSGYCWCVEQSGREIPGTRSEPGTTPPCLPSVAPPSVRPEPRPDVSPPASGTFLLYAQGQQIGYLPLNGTRLHKEAAKTLLSLHGSIVVGIDYDCRDRMIYWTDVAGRSISRAGLEPGSEPETIISSGLISPEGLAVDHLRRAVFWTDSGLDRIERARLDGSERRVLFDSDLVNPRAIAVDPVRGNLYWTDWNREAPKIETSTVNGANRRVLVHTDIGLPNGLTFDPFSKLLCWADAGTKHLECTFPDGTGRRVIQSNLNYPFSIVSYANHFYHTDWRRDGVIAVNKETGSFTDEYLPEQRSHLYGITAVYPYCPGGKNPPKPHPLVNSGG